MGKGKKEIKRLLKQLQSELSIVNIRLDRLETSISDLRKDSLHDSKQISELDGRLFKTECQLIDVNGATKLLEYDVEQISKRLSQVTEASEKK